MTYHADERRKARREFVVHLGLQVAAVVEGWAAAFGWWEL